MTLTATLVSTIIVDQQVTAQQGSFLSHSYQESSRLSEDRENMNPTLSLSSAQFASNNYKNEASVAVQHLNQSSGTCHVNLPVPSGAYQTTTRNNRADPDIEFLQEISSVQSNACKTIANGSANRSRRGGHMRSLEPPVEPYSYSEPNQDGVVIVANRRGQKNCLYHAGFVYFQEKHRPGIFHYKCYSYRAKKVKCAGRMVVCDSDFRLVSTNNKHTHPPYANLETYIAIQKDRMVEPNDTRQAKYTRRRRKLRELGLLKPKNTQPEPTPFKGHRLSNIEKRLAKEKQELPVYYGQEGADPSTSYQAIDQSTNPLLFLSQLSNGGTHAQEVHNYEEVQNDQDNEADNDDTGADDDNMHSDSPPSPGDFTDDGPNASPHMATTEAGHGAVTFDQIQYTSSIRNFKPGSLSTQKEPSSSFFNSSSSTATIKSHDPLADELNIQSSKLALLQKIRTIVDECCHTSDQIDAFAAYCEQFQLLATAFRPISTMINTSTTNSAWQPSQPIVSTTKHHNTRRSYHKR